MRNAVPKRSAPLAALAGLLLLTACGGNSSEAADANTAPIKLLVDTALTSNAAQGGVSFPWAATGVQAAAQAINDAGGLDGRRIEVKVCDNKGDPNTSAQCGRTAQKEKMTAVVGSFDGFGAPQLLRVLEAANIPYIGGVPASAAEFQSPVSFQFNPGAVLGAYALSQLAVDARCRSIAILTPQIPTAATVLVGQKSFLTAKGVTVTAVDVPNAAADVTPVVSSALAGKPDCLTFTGQGQLTSKMITSARNQGFTGKFITAVGSLLPQYLSSMGSAADGVLVNASSLPPSSTDPMATQFRNELTAYVGNDPAKVAQNMNEFAQAGWSSVQLVKQAFAGSTTLTPAYLLDKIPTMCDVNLGNFYPHVDFCKATGNEALPRIYNNQWRYYVAKDGKYVEFDNAWHNASGTVPS